MIHTANLENFKKYNFKSTLESQLEYLKGKENYLEMVELLTQHVEASIHTIKYFGDGKMAQKILKDISELVEYNCLPFHKCRYFYDAIKEIRNEASSHCPSDDYCIELMMKCIKIVKVQYGINN